MTPPEILFLIQLLKIQEPCPPFQVVSLGISITKAMARPASYPGIIPFHPNDTQGIQGAGRDDPSIFLG